MHMEWHVHPRCYAAAPDRDSVMKYTFHASAVTCERAVVQVPAAPVVGRTAVGCSSSAVSGEVVQQAGLGAAGAGQDIDQLSGRHRRVAAAHEPAGQGAGQQRAGALTHNAPGGTDIWCTNACNTPKRLDIMIS